MTHHRFTSGAASGQAHLRILSTTDIHVHIRAYDYYADCPDDRVGLSGTIAMARKARLEAANSVLVDNGDFLQGNPMGDWYAGVHRRTRDTCHPAIAAMNAAGYDAATLGNHEFNFGLDFLSHALNEARFPVIAANIATRLGLTPTQDTPFVPPYVILRRSVTDGSGAGLGLGIGIIGLVPPQTVRWDRIRIGGKVAARDMVEAAQAWVPEMRSQGADIVIALAHTGIGSADHTPGMENAAIPLARVAGIDAIVMGHTHRVFPSDHFRDQPEADVQRGTLAGKPAVMAGCWGSHLGVIDLLLGQSASGWHVLDHESSARPVGEAHHATPKEARRRTADPAVDAAVAHHHRRTLRAIRRPIGESLVDLHSFLSLAAPDAALQAVMDAQRWYVAELLLDHPAGKLPLLSAGAPFKMGGYGGPRFFTHVPKGRMTIRHAADLYAFPNTIRVLQIDGAQLADWLEHSAGAYARIIPGRADQPLLEPDFPCYNFDVIDGVTYVIDPAQPRRFGARGGIEDPAARRISALHYRGVPVSPMDRFVIVTNNYRADSGEFSAAAQALAVIDTPVPTRDILIRYIRSIGQLRTRPNPTWRFAPMPGTSAWFDTSPLALRTKQNIAGLSLRPGGITAGGFARLHLGF